MAGFAAPRTGPSTAGFYDGNVGPYGTLSRVWSWTPPAKQISRFVRQVLRRIKPVHGPYRFVIRRPPVLVAAPLRRRFSPAVWGGRNYRKPRRRRCRCAT